MERYQVVCIGLGGICEGYLPHLLLLHATGVVEFSRVLLVDGKGFRDENRPRQYFGRAGKKAKERYHHWLGVYPKSPLAYRCAYVDRGNVSEIVTDATIVFLSPDNHATRKLVSDHAETLDNILLLSGGNDAIDPSRGTEGVSGAVIVHCKVNGKDRTPPITRHHPEISHPEDHLPREHGCLELGRSHPQLLKTNLLVGQVMVQMLVRYVCLPLEEAVNVVEVGINSREESVVPYGLVERCLQNGPS